ncbi:hypothetical protein AB0I53_40105 [Saccharopolyspora sp. NPDC050389]|uniref:hypothetical protein n=1 Tax=Saccharopolyspora sp. NPDC050389 TaxID=3155516 RepID=UPI0033F68E3E
MWTSVAGAVAAAWVLAGLVVGARRYRHRLALAYRRVDSRCRQWYELRSKSWF